jgi:acetylornithine deacetylase/succinyl-diaminopimelate desuccinylase-like protein
MPAVGENALLKLAPLISELASQPPLQPNQEGLAFLSAVQGEDLDGRAGMEAGLERLRSSQPLLASLLAEPMLGITLSPTIAGAGEKANVIPSSAEALIDCRVPPGLGADQVRAALEALLGEGDYELEFSEAVIGNASPLETDLTALIRGWLAEADPGAGLAPIVWPAFSDSHWFREAFGSAVVYGFCPHREIALLEATQLLHSADERVPAADVGLAARFFFEFSQLVLS